ncbi:RNA polymerase sigma factor [Lutibaculum baratangense]|uniref:RNA polymerase sigma factor n=1 Tax=Lutibaculum baratangense AMV1 TaxID=631454 RepID=V4RJR4_9HYPH|nr:sigma-70 family RNA polymerase sigma factor [Lutibaculum baratangense]ESR23480.1 RNA polymerase sigma-70 factor, ECF subfamily [Lutibaculum baratangense AMV1]
MSGGGDAEDEERRWRGEDETLLIRIASGEQAALARLIDRHGRGLRLFAARYLGSAADAEDVVQDVFVSVWKHATRFDPAKARASTWLYRITANRCIDARRRRMFRTFVGLGDVHELLADDSPAADARVGARQELANVRLGLSRLPERQRMALLLRAVADLDVPHIAEVMGASVGSVEQLLVRGRRGLQAHMAKMQDLTNDHEEPLT